MTSKNKQKISSHKTGSGNPATIEPVPTPFLLVKEKFVVRIYCQIEPGKTLLTQRTNCQQSALAIIESWSSP